MYREVAQLMLLYVRKSLVVTREMLKILEGLHHRAARRIMGLTEKRGVVRESYYPLVRESMEVAGIHPIVLYIRRRQANIVKRVACHPIYELCTEVEHIPGTSRMVWWWDQDTVNEPEE